MADKIKVAVFDFCGTFINFQTADEFALYCLDDNKKRKLEKKLQFFNKTRISFFLGLFHYSLRKHLIASELKNLDVDKANLFVKEFTEKGLLPNINEDVLDIFIFAKSKGYHIVLVSAAYDIYLNEFDKYYHFDKIISTKLQVKNNKLTGRIKKDCLGKKKVKYLRHYLNNKFGKDNYDIIISIGDSKSDIPILDIAKNSIVIGDKKKKWFKRSYKLINEYKETT